MYQSRRYRAMVSKGRNVFIAAPPPTHSIAHFQFHTPPPPHSIAHFQFRRCSDVAKEIIILCNYDILCTLWVFKYLFKIMTKVNTSNRQAKICVVFDSPSSALSMFMFCRKFRHNREEAKLNFIGFRKRPSVR